MAKSGENMAKNYLSQKYGLDVTKIEETDEKRPDFEVKKEGEFQFYCEEKTIDNIFIQGLIDDSAYNTISKKIREAAKQFKSINPDHAYPNVLVINSMDEMKNYHDLYTTVTGFGIIEDGKKIRIHSAKEEVIEACETVDFVLWFEKDKFKNFMLLNPKYEEKLKGIFLIGEFQL